MINNQNILKTRACIKNKLLNDSQFVDYENHKQQILDLLHRTVETGESNSALLIGPRGVGKTTLVNSVLKIIQEDESFKSSAVLVHLHGLVHTDDRLALKAITKQMDLDNAVDGKVFGSFAENLSFLLGCLKAGQKETAKSVLFILEEFDLFCSHHNQTLLYNLFDISQSNQTPICVFGITCRLDVIELFEKRVKSRFSHRQIFLFPTSEDKSLTLRMDRIKHFLIIENNSVSKAYTNEWNSNIKSLLEDKKFTSLMQRLLDIDPSEQTLKNIMTLAISKLEDKKTKITPEDFEDLLKNLEKDNVISIIQDASTLELCLLVAMKHHSEIYEDQPFNFEMILTRYMKFASSNSNVLGAKRPVALKAFEHIQKMELISLVTNSRTPLQKEYQLFKLLITSSQIMEAIKQTHGLPTEVVQWANSSIS